jgi:hypothetical protein
MFTKEERSSFPYWFAHWCAFNMTALNLRIWKFKYLFHDIEKPWLMLFWKDYKKVQKWHREHNRHHAEYKGRKEFDFDSMIIDWECSRFTKESAPLNAWDTLNVVIKKKYPEKYKKIEDGTRSRMIELGLGK